MKNPRLLPDSAYAQGNTVPASYFQGLDTAGALAINGDAGGAWSLGEPLLVEGAGMWLCGPSTTSNGATIQTIPSVPPGNGKRIVHADNDVTLLVPNHILGTRTITTGCVAAGVVTTSGIELPLNSQSAGIAGAFCIGQIGGRILMPLDVHALATFANATLTFLANTHSQLPDTMPSMRVYAIDAFGDIVLLGGAPGSAGYVALPKPANVSAYSGLKQQIVYPIAVNGVPGAFIDKLDFTYYAEIVDESGAGAVGLNGYLDITSTFTNIGSLYFP